jgi:hypothetical protein
MRRLIVVLVILGTLLGTAMPVLADEAGGGKTKASGMPFRWKATSPSTHEGDQYTLLVTNTDEKAQEAQISTVIMDHSNHTNTDVVDEKVELAPGEEREFTAANGYGTANHFNTIIGSETKNLDLAVKVADSDGAETASFNDGAFLIQKGNAKGSGATANKHDHGGTFAVFVPVALWDTMRLSPLPLGVLAIAGFGLYAARRRQGALAGALAGPVGARLAGPVAMPPALPRERVWKAAAVGGLVLSAALHIGLAPEHFEEAAAQGVFFYAAGVVAAIIGAAILAWPSRLAYLSGAGISLALIVLWAFFRIVPPPGAETVEVVDLVGVLTKATEVVAAATCIMLWLRTRRTRQPDRTEPQAS